MLIFYLVSIVVSQENVIFYVICRIYRNVNNFLETFQSSHDPLLFWIFFFLYQTFTRYKKLNSRQANILIYLRKNNGRQERFFERVVTYM